MERETERYRRGHNGADSKSVCEQSHGGSNPPLSAKTHGARIVFAVMYKLNMTYSKKLPFLKYISQGVKQIECRVATDYVRNFKTGGILKLVSNGGSFVLCKVTHLNFYKNFEDMLKNEGFKNAVPFVSSFDEALSIYKKFKGANRVAELGCCAIGIKCLNGIFNE